MQVHLSEITGVLADCVEYFPEPRCSQSKIRNGCKKVSHLNYNFINPELDIQRLMDMKKV